MSGHSRRVCRRKQSRKPEDVHGPRKEAVSTMEFDQLAWAMIGSCKSQKAASEKRLDDAEWAARMPEFAMYIDKTKADRQVRAFIAF